MGIINYHFDVVVWGTWIDFGVDVEAGVPCRLLRRLGNQSTVGVAKMESCNLPYNLPGW